MAGSPMDIGFQAFRKTLELGIMSGWPTQRSDSGVCGTRTRSPVFVRHPRCAASSVTRRRASSPLIGAQKNSLWRLQQRTLGLVRPQASSRARSVVRRHAGISRLRGAACRVPALRYGEAGAPGASRRQPAVHQALCPSITWAGAADRRRSRTLPRNSIWTGYGQDAGEAVHACAAGPCRQTRAEGHRHR